MSHAYPSELNQLYVQLGPWFEHQTLHQQSMAAFEGPGRLCGRVGKEAYLHRLPVQPTGQAPVQGYRVPLRGAYATLPQ